MANAEISLATLVLWLTLASAARAEPVHLKLAYFSSDRSSLYIQMVKPFVDAVNSDPSGAAKIDVSFSGVLGKDPTQQLQLVLDGTADLAYIITGYTPERFPDDGVIALPGLYRNSREASLVFTRLIANATMNGYQDLFVVGAYGNEPESIHTRSAASTLDALQGRKIRANNPVEAAALTSLGMVPIEIPINKVSEAISSGAIDGATVPPGPLIEFGISRVAAHHYLLGVGSVPLALVMKREKFNSLPANVQDVIRSYSGEWAAERYTLLAGEENKTAIAHLQSAPNRKVVFPSDADRRRADAAFKTVIETWQAADPHRRELLALAEAELAKIRSGQ